MASMVIVLFEVITIKGTISTFLHLELLFPEVLLNKVPSLIFPIYNSAGSHYPVTKECFFVSSYLNLKQQPTQFAKV